LARNCGIMVLYTSTITIAIKYVINIG